MRGTEPRSCPSAHAKSKVTIHIIQQRLKLAGAWWKETQSQAMLNLRIARTKNLQSIYWPNN